jgi:F-type H+-transporting ATPase subunit gamma
MKRPIEIEQEEQTITTLAELTTVFEGIASMRISQIKNQVLQATQFFDELWGIYTQLRVSPVFGFGRGNASVKVSDKELYILITAEGGLSGDIDQKLIQLMLTTYDSDKHDIIVIGHHGAIQLVQRGVRYEKYFKLPIRDQNINVSPIIKEVQQYRLTTVFYQEYVSLMVQDVKRIELSRAVQTQGRKSDQPDEIISEVNYIFEPSTYEVVDHLERSMMHIAMSQLILDSKLAQYASRFRAMSTSSQRANEIKSGLHLDYNRAKRSVKDTRLKEIIGGLKSKRLKEAAS